MPIVVGHIAPIKAEDIRFPSQEVVEIRFPLAVEGVRPIGLASQDPVKLDEASLDYALDIAKRMIAIPLGSGFTPSLTNATSVTEA